MSILEQINVVRGSNLTILRRSKDFCSLETANRQPRNGQGHLIELRQVVKTYESAAGIFTALKGVDLEVGDGQFLSIVGKSGSGKSTLINMITGIDRPTSGQVLVDDIAVHTLNEEQIAVWRGRTIGVIFQFFQLLPTLTAVENIMLPMDYCQLYSPSQRPERAIYLLEKMGMADYAHKLHSALSGGQQQSIAIARALATKPQVLLMDEPCSALDPIATGRIEDLIEQLKDNYTIVIVTHNMQQAARVSERAAFLCLGELIEYDVTSKIFGNPSKKQTEDYVTGRFG